MARPRKPHLCNVCGVATRCGYCADCEDELKIRIHICDNDRCRAEHVVIFHGRIEFGWPLSQV
jgi:hypothetical protein